MLDDILASPQLGAPPKITVGEADAPGCALSLEGSPLSSYLPHTTRPFRYDLNQIPYDYTVEVRNRFKGLNLTECLKNYGQRFMTLFRKG